MLKKRKLMFHFNHCSRDSFQPNERGFDFVLAQFILWTYASERALNGIPFEVSISSAKTSFRLAIPASLSSSSTCPSCPTSQSFICLKLRTVRKHQILKLVIDLHLLRLQFLHLLRLQFLTGAALRSSHLMRDEICRVLVRLPELLFRQASLLERPAIFPIFHLRSAIVSEHESGA